MFASLRRSLTARANGSARSKPRRRAASLRTFDVLEDRVVLSALNLVSAVGIGGDDLQVGPTALNDSADITGGTAIDSHGNMFVAGEFEGNVNFDPQGGSQWDRSTNGGYDMFVAEYNPQGAPVWVDQFTDSSDYQPDSPTDLAWGLAVDKNDNVYVTGVFTDEVNFNPNPGQKQNVVPYSNEGDIFVLKLGSKGGYEAMQDFGDDTYDYNTGYGIGTGIAVDPTGNYVAVVGVFANSIDFNPNSGTGNGVVSTNEDAAGFVVELNSYLSFQWVRIVLLRVTRPIYLRGVRWQ